MLFVRGVTMVRANLSNELKMFAMMLFMLWDFVIQFTNDDHSDQKFLPRFPPDQSVQFVSTLIFPCTLVPINYMVAISVPREHLKSDSASEIQPG